MAHRVLDVTAHTTLDYVEAAALGPDWSDEGTGVLDVHGSSETTDGVTLAFERDPATLDRVDGHADELHLTGGQARTLLAALETAIEADGSDRPARLRG